MPRFAPSFQYRVRNCVRPKTDPNGKGYHACENNNFFESKVRSLLNHIYDLIFIKKENDYDHYGTTSAATTTEDETQTTSYASLDTTTTDAESAGYRGLPPTATMPNPSAYPAITGRYDDGIFDYGKPAY